MNVSPCTNLHYVQDKIFNINIYQTNNYLTEFGRGLLATALLQPPVPPQAQLSSLTLVVPSLCCLP